MTHNERKLTVDDLYKLGTLAAAVQAGQPITYMDDEGGVCWGIARAFTNYGGGFLSDEDVRDAFVWLSGGSHFGEAWVPVMDLVSGIAEGRVVLDYRP